MPLLRKKRGGKIYERELRGAGQAPFPA